MVEESIPAEAALPTKKNNPAPPVAAGGAGHELRGYLIVFTWTVGVYPVRSGSVLVTSLSTPTTLM